jgi:hypothetical protein
MNEYVLAAVAGLDEAIALAGVKPLYSSYRHSVLHSVGIKLACPVMADSAGVFAAAAPRSGAVLDLGLSREGKGVSS